MAESLTTAHSYLSVSSFPILVLTEAGALDDMERTQVMEHIEGLLDEGNERQVLVIDLSEGELLPETQRVYVADFIQLHAGDIAKKWPGLAIVVGATGAERATFWQECSPVPVRTFPGLEAALVWARGELGIAPPSTGVSTERRSLRPSEAQSTRVPGPVANWSAPSGLLGWLLAPRGLLVVGAAVLGILFLILGPASEDRLSSSDEAAFQKLKSEFALRAFRQAQGGRLSPLKSGDKCQAGDKVALELDLPAPGFSLVLQAKAGGSLKALWPPAPQPAGRMKVGKGLRLPRTYPVDGAREQETFYVAYCPVRFAIGDCRLSGSSVTCPEGCVVKDFSISK